MQQKMMSLKKLTKINFKTQDDSDIEPLEKKIENIQNQILYISGLVTTAALDTNAIKTEKISDTSRLIITAGFNTKAIEIGNKNLTLLVQLKILILTQN